MFTRQSFSLNSVWRHKLAEDHCILLRATQCYWFCFESACPLKILTMYWSLIRISLYNGEVTSVSEIITHFFTNKNWVFFKLRIQLLTPFSAFWVHRLDNELYRDDQGSSKNVFVIIELFKHVHPFCMIAILWLTTILATLVLLEREFQPSICYDFLFKSWN